ncbi:hypothetical protein DENIS_3362 [Desulfonema ishimotonii]|uniref:Uncharacterized protein n=1 Tax=Desulfonema ishimotonii TaxID=45657 RepID=A0A401FZK6_9BACT|nr:hypothetical protein DENIS_3362 [Desulfonema ishimotonii]
MARFGHNREAGEIPARTRRCERRRNPHTPLNRKCYDETVREGAGSRMNRKSEDLPEMP